MKEALETFKNLTESTVFGLAAVCTFTIHQHTGNIKPLSAMKTKDKTDNELIADFLYGESARTVALGYAGYSVSVGDNMGKIILLKDMHFEKSWEWLMPVVEKIHKSKTFIPWFCKEPMGVIVSIHPNSCSINLPNPNEGYDYVEGCYYAPSTYCFQHSK